MFSSILSSVTRSEIVYLLNKNVSLAQKVIVLYVFHSYICFTCVHMCLPSVGTCHSHLPMYTVYLKMYMTRTTGSLPVLMVLSYSSQTRYKLPL